MLGIVLVNYKTEDKTVEYVRTELSKIQSDYKLVIVNNSCTEESNIKLAEGCKAEIVRDADKINEASDTFVLGVKDNLGYAKGNNLGADFLNAHFDINYFLFTNNDLKLVDEDIVERLIEKAKQHDDIGAIGPKVVGLDGKDQSPLIKRNIWLHVILALFFPFLCHLSFYRKKILKRDIKHSTGFCHSVIGAFFLCRVRAFKEIKGFDNETFLFAEEDIIASRLQNAGYKVYYFDEVKVIHEHHVTVNSHLELLEISNISLKSNMLYFRKYRNSNILTITLMRLSFMYYLYVWRKVVILPLKKLFSLNS